MPTQHNPIERRLVRLETAAEYADCGVKTIRRLIAAGDLAGYRLGNRIIRVDLNQLEALFKRIPTGRGDVA